MSDENYKLEKSIAVTLQGTRRRFSSIEKIEGFLEETEQFYERYNDLSYAVSCCLKNLHEEVDSILQSEVYFQEDEGIILTKGVKRLEAILESAFHPKGIVFYPESKEALCLIKYGAEASDKNAFAAAYSGAASNSQGSLAEISHRIRNILQWGSFSAVQGAMARAVKDHAHHSPEAIHEAIKQMRVLRDDIIQQANEHGEEVYESRVRTIRLRHHLETEVVPEFKSKIRKVLEEAQQDVNETVSHFREHIASKEAVTYWADKLSKASHQAWRYVALTVFMLMTMLWCEYELVSTVSDSTSTLGKLFDRTAKDSPALTIWLTVLGVSLVAMLFVWPCRYLMASASSSFLYARYCDNKAMQIQTFLAMDQSGHIDSKQKQIIIEKIFSDYQESGAGNGELPSVSALAAAMKAVQGKGQH